MVRASIRLPTPKHLCHLLNAPLKSHHLMHFLKIQSKEVQNTAAQGMGRVVENEARGMVRSQIINAHVCAIAFFFSVKSLICAKLKGQVMIQVHREGFHQPSRK